MDGRYSAGSRLTASALLNAAFELYRRQARAAWTIVALIVVPAQILVWIMIRVSLSGDALARHGTIYASSGVALPTVAVTLLGFLSGLLTVGALSRLMVEAYTGRRASWEKSLAFASSNFLPLVILAVVLLVGLVLGYVFIVPGIFLTVAWSAAVPVLMFERASPVRALGRSWELIRGYWWTIFGALLLSLLIIVGISFLVDLVLTGAQSSSSIDLILTLEALARALGAILTYPFLAALAVVIYANLRAVKEGVRPESLMPEASAA
jgi:hypothetical protein